MDNSGMGHIGQEPSMEDILASIKRIIAEDGEGAAAPAAVPTVRMPRARRDEPGAAAPAALDAGEVADDVLELTRPIDPVIARASAAGAAPRPAEGADLLSSVAADAGRNAFAALSSAVTQPGGAGNPLESMLREMLRPMLRDWLDTNLPSIVERMVAGEIARISGRR